tara:strand:- start:1321 stop:3702 length:2382 start_codon:yes stop_codon:yes gene_type:complete
MWQYISKFILRNRVLLIFLIFGLTSLMAYKGKDAKLAYTMAKLLPSDHHVSTEYQDFLEMYGEQNLFVIAIKDPEILKFNNLADLNHITQKIEDLDGVENIVSLTNLPILIKDTSASNFILKRWYSEGFKSQQEIDSSFNNFSNHLIYKDFLNNSQNTITTLLISIDDNIIRTPNRAELIFKIKDIVNSYEKKYNASIYFSGLPYIRTIDSLMVKDEITQFILLALIITTVILFLFFKSYKVTIAAMITVVIGVIFSFGSIVILGYDISIFMAIVPPLIIVIGIPNCVFLINKYHSEFIKSGKKFYALQIMIQKIGNITLLTNLTTAAGFASFILTNSETLQEFGVIASLNIIFIFILSLCIIPIYFSFSSSPSKKHTEHLTKKWLINFINYLAFLVKNKRKTIYCVTLFVIIVASFGITKVKTTGNLTDDLPKNQQLFKDLKFLEKTFGGVIPLEVIVDTKKKKGLMKSYNLKKIDTLINLLNTFPEFSKPISYIDLLKHAKQAFYNGDSNFYKLPNSQEISLINKFLKRTNGEMSYSTSLIDPSQQKARISLRVADISSVKMDSVFRDLKPKIDKIFDPQKYNVTITGSTIVFLEGTKFLLKNLVTSLSLVIILISIFMAWMFNSFRMVIISIIPNLIPLLLTASIMGYFGVALKPSTILVFSIAFGISVDDTIHFLAKYRQELLSNNWNINISVFSALKETGISMFYTSVVLFFGFFIFVVSDFGGTIALGLLVSITLMIAMLANLIIMPALLLSLEKIINYEAFNEPLIDTYDEEVDIELSKLKIRKNK